MLRIVTLLWDSPDHVYDESWVCRLFDGVRRHLTLPYQFVLFTDRRRDVDGRDVLQVLLDRQPPSGASFLEPCRLDDPMILTGLDTVVTGSLDDLAGYCLSAAMPALPRNPDHPAELCAAVALVPAGCRDLYQRWKGESDAAALMQRCKVIDHLFPGQVTGFTGQRALMAGTRLVFFQGLERPDRLTEDAGWITEHWRTDD